MSNVQTCRACDVRLAEGSSEHFCPSCSEQYSLVRIKCRWCPEWLWKVAIVLWRWGWKTPALAWLSVEVAK